MGKNKFSGDGLGDRMKSYEKVTTGLKMIPKMPILIRLDGVAFHSFAKKFDKPFDVVLSDAMALTMQDMCKEVQTCVFGYTQSDEITLILNLPDKVKSEPYLGGRLFKEIGITASKCTRIFNSNFIKCANNACNDGRITAEQLLVYMKKYDKADFDCRVWNMPEWDIINNIIWRQQDAVRNSIESLGQYHFTASELHKKNCNKVKEMLLTDRNVIWEDLESRFKWGVCSYKVGEKGSRPRWCIDYDMPIINLDREWFSSVTGLKEE